MQMPLPLWINYRLASFVSGERSAAVSDLLRAN